MNKDLLQQADKVLREMEESQVEGVLQESDGIRDVERIIKALAEELRGKEWKLIEDERPPHEEVVLLGWYTWDGAWVYEATYFSRGERVGNYSNMSEHGQATHWQPLPQPPKEKTDG